MYTLFGAKGSGSAAVEVALESCGLPFTIVRAASWEKDSAIEELRKVNPLLLVPTLVLPDGGVMTESAAILLHLGLDVPAARALLPQDAGARAQSIRGLVFIAAHCYSAIGIMDYPQRWTTATDEAGLDSVRQGTRRQLHRNWEIFADTFPGDAVPQWREARRPRLPRGGGLPVGRHARAPEGAPAAVPATAAGRGGA